MNLAFTSGLCNGRAKSFVNALARFLLDDEEHCKVRMYAEMETTAVGISDNFQGRVRYLDPASYKMSSSFPDTEISQVQTSWSGSGSVTSSSIASDCEVASAAYYPGKVHKPTADCLVFIRKHMEICLVFEATSTTDRTKMQKSIFQNFIQMTSLLHHQRSMLGCVVSPTGYTFQLVCKEDHGDGKSGTISFYQSPVHQFTESRASSFNTGEFLHMCHYILKVMFCYAGNLRAVEV